MAETPRQNAPRIVQGETAHCRTCGTRFLKRRPWQECCSDRCRRAGTQKITLPVRLAIKEAIRLLDREAGLRRLSVEGGWQQVEEHARALKEFIGEPPA